MRPTAPTIRRILDLLDWSGHIEIATTDMDWLSEQLSARLLNPDMQVCDNCDTPRDIVVPTAIGSICESCLEELADSASAMRDSLED